MVYTPQIDIQINSILMEPQKEFYIFNKLYSKIYWKGKRTKIAKIISQKKNKFGENYLSVYF